MAPPPRPGYHSRPMTMTSDDPRPERPFDRRAFFVRAGGLAASTLLLPGLDLRQALAAAATGKTTRRPGAPAAGGALAADALPARFRTVVADLEKKFPYAFALYTRDEDLNITVDRSGVSVNGNGPREGIVLGVYDGRGLREEASSFVTADGLQALRDRLLATPGVLDRVPGPDPGPRLERSWVETGARPPAALPLEERVDRARALHAEFVKRDTRLLSGRVSITTGITERVFVNRTRSLHQVLHRGGNNTFALVSGASGGSPGAYWHRRRGVGGYELCEMSDAEIALTLERAARLAGAAAPPPGLTTVVLAPDITGTLAHESFGHGVETDLFPQGRARAADYLGKRVGSPLVQIFDDPTQAGGNGFYHFDDEGASAASTRIVEDGVFRSGLTDLLSSERLRIARTANGRRESSSNKAYARMSSTFFGRGRTPKDAVIGGVTDGIYVTLLRAGIEDPKGWGIQIVAQYGEEIKAGRLTGRAYSPVTLSGYVPDVLAGIDAVGDDFELWPGTCGKGYKEFIPVSMGGPHLRLKARVS